jgi:site-specific DNA-methyltransferase (adenine-specific)
MTVTLHLGDCLEYMRTMPAGSVDAVVTDLPYGTTACAWDSVIPFAPMWEAVKRVLKPRGVFVTTASQPFTSALVMSNMEWFKYEWIWDKVNVTGFLDVKQRPMKRHENVIVFSSGQGCYNPAMSGKATSSFGKLRNGTNKISIFAGEFGSSFEQGLGYPQSIVRFQRPTNLTDDDFGLHPTQKPVTLYEYLVRTYTNPGDAVLDFCFGSGTTGVACVRTGRNFIGCEIDPTYYAIAQRRIAEAQLQPPLIPHEAVQATQARLDV